MSQWGDRVWQHMPRGSSYQQARALDVAENYFGGSINYLDLYIASVTRDGCEDNVADGYMTKRFGWGGPKYHVTRAGRELLWRAG